MLSAMTYVLCQMHGSAPGVGDEAECSVRRSVMRGALPDRHPVRSARTEPHTPQ